MKIVQEEIFGPVGVLIKFEDEEDVIRQANDTLYGLAAAVFSQDINRALETAHKLKAGTAWVNCINTLNANVPFGGYKQSGSTYCSPRCPPLNLILATSDIQLAASWESTPYTTTPTLRRCTSIWVRRCKFTCVRVKETDPKAHPNLVTCLPPPFCVHVYIRSPVPMLYFTRLVHYCPSIRSRPETDGKRTNGLTAR